MSARIGRKQIPDEPAATPLSGDEASPSAQPVEGSELPALARRAVETFVLERRIIAPMPDTSSPLLNQRSACFVSIKTFDRELRGCIGTVEPEKDTLAEEIIANAINSATRDPRFLPVSPAELPYLRYSVDVLEQAEPARIDDLDPAVFGVIVTDNLGLKRGLLLPGIEGINTATQQVQIAARKAGIVPQEPLRLFRFRACRFTERHDLNQQ
jgi:AmmeMemoRadiSam system protein A